MIWRDHPLCAPADRWPPAFWGPEPLDAQAWRDFSARLDVTAEVEVIDGALQGAGSVLDVGGGLGTITRKLRLGGRRCALIDPSVAAERVTQADDGTPIRFVPGQAEALPFDDGSFEAVVATWILQYTADPGRAVAEMIRVAAPHARVLIVQAHPDNPIVRCYNACAAIAGRAPAHHGFLLALAAEALERARFTSVELARVPAFVGVDLSSPADLERLASTVVDLHFAGSSHGAAMRSKALELLGQARTGAAVADHGVLLTGRR